MKLKFCLHDVYNVENQQRPCMKLPDGGQCNVVAVALMILAFASITLGQIVAVIEDDVFKKLSFVTFTPIDFVFCDNGQK